MSSWSNLILKYFNIIWALSSLEKTSILEVLGNATHLYSLLQGGSLVS